MVVIKGHFCLEAISSVSFHSRCWRDCGGFHCLLLMEMAALQVSLQTLLFFKSLITKEHGLLFTQWTPFHTSWCKAMQNVKSNARCEEFADPAKVLVAINEKHDCICSSFYRKRPCWVWSLSWLISICLSLATCWDIRWDGLAKREPAQFLV